MIKTSITKNNYLNTKTQVLFWFDYIYSRWQIVDACTDGLRYWDKSHAASLGEIKKKISMLR